MVKGEGVADRFSLSQRQSAMLALPESTLPALTPPVRVRKEYRSLIACLL